MAINIPLQRVGGLLAGGLLALFLLSLLAGAGGLSAAPAEVWALRAWRGAAALLVGAACAVSARLLQDLSGNPVAEPGLLGVHAAAALALVCALCFLHWRNPLALLLASLGGSLLALLALGALLPALQARQRSAHSLILAGVALSASCGGLASLIMLRQADGLDQYRQWVLGSLALVQADMLLAAGALLGAVLCLMLLCAPYFSLLHLGHSRALTAGAHPARLRLHALLCCSLAAAGAVALAGPLGFCGMLGVWLAQGVQTRWLPGCSARLRLGLCAACGAALLLLCDCAARLLAAPYESPLGVLCALPGALVLLWRLQARPPGAAA
ncbi:iron chelate uptake ABC transporter family permease subunit [Massilia sp. W12]|uniref:iron chelate uptake ABC transporter family permease subunit n=1 Tax=Massilia sp. W12 TaxID=3126507 RepID=UPI0030CAFEFB